MTAGAPRAWEGGCSMIEGADRGDNVLCRYPTLAVCFFLRGEDIRHAPYGYTPPTATIPFASCKLSKNGGCDCDNTDRVLIPDLKQLIFFTSKTFARQGSFCCWCCPVQHQRCQCRTLLIVTRSSPAPPPPRLTFMPSVIIVCAVGM